jgi:DNA-binding NtrC family response regulator
MPWHRAVHNQQTTGNIRELENLVERSVILTEGSTLRMPLAELRPQPESAETDGPMERCKPLVANTSSACCGKPEEFSPDPMGPPPGLDYREPRSSRKCGSSE